MSFRRRPKPNPRRIITLLSIGIALLLTVASMAIYFTLTAERTPSTAEKSVRQYILYREQFNGLTQPEATKRLKADGFRVAVGEIDGEPQAFLDVRIMPPGVVTAYLSVFKSHKSKMIVQDVRFDGESDHFEYYDILRNQGEDAARSYAEQHNLD